MTIHQIDVDVWTPKIVGDELLEAVRWANSAAGAVGPARIRSGMPDLAMISADRDFEGWPPIADLEVQPMRRMLPPARVSQFERVIWWQAKYLPGQAGPARVLKFWIRARLTKGMSFDKVCDGQGWNRGTAYRVRDKALSTIAIGLTADGIAHGQH